MTKSVLFILFVAFIFCLQSCSEKNSTDPIECYKLWAKKDPPSDVKPIRANYWQSASWSKEYILFIELEASVGWKRQFIIQNHLAQSSNKFMLPSDAPFWFKRDKNYQLWRSAQDDNNEYVEDTLTGHFFIYEEQL